MAPASSSACCDLGESPDDGVLPAAKAPPEAVNGTAARKEPCWMPGSFVVTGGAECHLTQGPYLNRPHGGGRAERRAHALGGGQSRPRARASAVAVDAITFSSAATPLVLRLVKIEMMIGAEDRGGQAMAMSFAVP